MVYLDFEKPLADIEGKAEELRAMARKGEGAVDVEKEAEALDRKAASCWTSSTRTSTPGGSARSPAIPTARIAATISRRCSPNTRRWPATAPLATIMR